MTDTEQALRELEAIDLLAQQVGTKLLAKAADNLPIGARQTEIFLRQGPSIMLSLVTKLRTALARAPAPVEPSCTCGANSEILVSPTEARHASWCARSAPDASPDGPWEIDGTRSDILGWDVFTGSTKEGDLRCYTFKSEREALAVRDGLNRVAPHGEPRDCPMCGDPDGYGHVCPERSD